MQRAKFLLAAALVNAACSSEQPPPPPQPKPADRAPAARANPAASSEPTPPACDISTKEAAIQTWMGLTGSEPTGIPGEFGCTELLPGLDAALFDGGGQTGGVCFYKDLVHDCKLLRVSDASVEVLAAKGWGTASKEERARLAMLWTREVVFAGRRVLDEETAAFEKANKKFTAPTVETLPSGEVVVDLWVQYRGGIGTPGMIRRWEVTFAVDGSLSKLEKGAIEAFGYPTKAPS